MVSGVCSFWGGRSRSSDGAKGEAELRMYEEYGEGIVDVDVDVDVVDGVACQSELLRRSKPQKARMQPCRQGAKETGSGAPSIKERGAGLSFTHHAINESNLNGMEP